MKIYSIDNQDGQVTSFLYCETLREARKLAKETAESGTACTISWSEVVRLNRKAVASLLNHRGWSTGKHGYIERWDPVKMVQERKSGEVYNVDTWSVRRVAIKAGK